MAKKANRKMIGAFIVISVAVLAVSVVIFSSGDYFKKKTQYVLYFDGSVKGLEIGSPVLFRGVQVGAVTDIVIRAYVGELKSQIPVFIEVYPDRFQVVGGDRKNINQAKRVPKLIEMGLRAQLVTQSMITGRLDIQVSMHPDTRSNLKNLDKGYTEIPTIPSTLAKLEKSLEKLDLKEIIASLTSVLQSADRILKNPDIDASLHELKGVLQDARVLVNNVNSKVDPLAENLNNTITDARGLVKDVDGEVKPLSGKAKSALDDISKLARHVDAEVDPVSKSVTDALSAAESAFKSIDDLVGKDSPVRADLEDVLRELSAAARAFRVLADYLEQHPDALLKGKSRRGY
ncbi:MAG: MCE family protein [Deltaproteobacteria bacterium]|nr:MCE family protein [Deltaproteobacteria bacterium]